jgi:Flp pilus assembly pilin Flp
MSLAVSAILKLARDEDGASLAEYALLLVLIVIVLLGATALLGSQISAFFTSASTVI